MSACALSVLAREEEYLKVSANYSRDELSEISQSLALLVMEMEEQPFTDVLGPFYLEVAAHSSKQARGEFFTPPGIAKGMARMLINAEEMKTRGIPISVSEPACGSGVMVLAVAEMFAPDSVDLLRFTCQDINPVAADMCYINTTLWGIPAEVRLGNSLAPTPIASWKNPHWRRVREDHRQMIKEIRELVTSGRSDERVAPLGTPAATSQLEFDLTDLRKPTVERRA